MTEAFPGYEAHREAVRTFVRRELPADLAARVRTGHHLDKEDYLRWQRVLHAHGWAGVSWPREHGGTGWDAIERHIFEEEAAAADAPPLSHFGLLMFGPVLQRYGTPAQQARWLPRILSGEDWWCQGYSERGAGSDLAALTTRARRDGDAYVVSGHKLWTTQAHFASMMFALVRTAAGSRGRQGISFLLVPMDAPGVTVRPIRTLEEAHTVNEVLLDDVRVPSDHLVGEEGRGWEVSRYLLGFERAFIGDVPRNRRKFARLRSIAERGTDGRGRVADDGAFAERMARAGIGLDALEALNHRVLKLAAEGRAGEAIEANMLKIRGSEITLLLNELMVEALGPDALPYPAEGVRTASRGLEPHADGVMAQHLYERATAIYGGSNEIQRDIIARELFR